MEISEITRRNIIDELRAAPVRWHGRFKEVEFLSRLYRLEELPSHDLRFPNMEADIIQHRVNNNDWPDDWVFEDSRLDLLGSTDAEFLKFLCLMVHPVVRTDAGEVEILLSIFNRELSGDGYEIYESGKQSTKPIFSARVITSPIAISNEPGITAQFVREQLAKCDSKLKSGDLDGAIASSRSLVEGVLAEIFNRCTGQRLTSSGDLQTDYKRVKDLLNLSEDQHIHEGLKGLIRSFGAVIQNIDYLSNKMGDRHRPILKPERHHAKLVVDSAKTMVDFLYSTIENQTNRRAGFVDALIDLLSGERRFRDREELLKDPEIVALLASSDLYLRRLVKKELIANYDIDSYRKSDIFFAAMRILLEDLEVDDVVWMRTERQRNDQAIGWAGFQKVLEQGRPELLREAVKKIYE